MTFELQTTIDGPGLPAQGEVIRVTGFGPDSVGVLAGARFRVTEEPVANEDGTVTLTVEQAD